MFVLIKNGNRVIARADTGAELREVALELIKQSPAATFEAAQVVRRVRTEYTPPQRTVIEEDV